MMTGLNLRRRCLQGLTLIASPPAHDPAWASSHACTDSPGNWAAVRPDTPLRFAQDHGAHPCHRTEWWYVTGWLKRPNAADAGFQLTFFRSRTAHPAANPSAFAPQQLVLAHAALALPERGHLLHAERAARAGFGLAGTEHGDTHAWIGTGARAWSLIRDPVSGQYRARVQATEFAFELTLATDEPPLLQGERGFSRKGPGLQHASHYYSRPQLRVSGQLEVGQPAKGSATRSTTAGAASQPVTGLAWFDHEWSSELLAPGVVGWDWCGINLDDGGALMAFRLRNREGSSVWRDALWRSGRQGPVRRGLAPVFEPVRHWQSTRSGARWPVHMRLLLDGRRIELQPLFDDQELDARGSTGLRYWEGAVTAMEGGRRIGRGYLELTGYAGAVRL